MRSTALPQHHYRDPCEVLEAKQSREAREKRKAEDRKSPARKALEELFSPPPLDRER
jgi:hypothetical protein